MSSQVIEKPVAEVIPSAARTEPIEKSALVQFISNQIKPAIIAFELGLIILIVRTFSLENKAFLQLMVIAFGGFIVNHLLPQRLRLPFFTVLSVGAIAYIMDSANAAWLVGIGLVLIGAAHLPIPFNARVALIIAIAGTLALMRKSVFTTPISPAVWPILGSMFMFRLMVYLYDLKHKTAPFGFWRALSYFFMLPNVCFPLFPVVDYRTYCRSHYNDDANRIYQVGIHWIFRGVMQLLAYRLVYQVGLIDPTTITDGFGSLQFALATYLLYLKVSGTFHLIVGLLHLFGFNLSETNHLYLLSSSFSDFWRRINIYWKEFILKLFFNPLYFQMKRVFSPANAIIAATMLAFTATWLLHSYQTFWICGDFPITWRDIAFWGILAIGVAVTAVYETRVTRKKTLGNARPSLAAQLFRAACAMTMFAFLCILWTLWNSPTWSDWTTLMSHFGHANTKSVAATLGVLLTIGIASLCVGHTSRLATDARGAAKNSSHKFWPQMILLIVVTSVVLGIGRRPLVLAFSPRAFEIVDDLKHPERLNERDTKILERGYYEDLTNTARINPELAELFTDRPADWNTGHTVRQTGSFPPYEMIPLQKEIYKGVEQNTNRWGMRDREYEMAKPPGVIRIALLGSSHTKGSGVNDDQTYENLAEGRLNREDTLGGQRQFEILNFSVGGYGPLCRLATLQKKVLDFHPDVVISEGIDDMTWIVTEMANAVEKGIELPFEPIRSIIDSTGVAKGTPRLMAEQKLKARAEEALAWTYAQIATDCKDRGIAAYAMFLPRPEDIKEEKDIIAQQTRLAEKAGLRMLDVSAAYSSVKKKDTLWVAKWDRHPGVQGHRLVADLLYENIRSRVLPAIKD